MQYNQPTSGQHVRIGNWLEELKLKEDTGVRFAPNPHDRTTSLMTRSRCIDHTDQLLPKDYSTTLRETFKNPNNLPEAKWSIQPVGPRERMLTTRFNNIIEEEVKAKTIKQTINSKMVDYTTENLSNYTKKGFEYKKHEVPVQLKHSDMPITIYTDSLRRDAFPFPSTHVVSVRNPFAKCDMFSGSFEHNPAVNRGEIVHNVPTISDYQIIENFNKRLMSMLKRYDDAPGRSVRHIFSIIWDLSTLNSDNVRCFPTNSLSNFLLNDFNFNMSQLEKNTLRSVYGVGDSDDVVFPDYMNQLRKRPSEHRLELVYAILEKITNPSNNGHFDESRLRKRFKGSNYDSFLSDLKAISAGSNNCQPQGNFIFSSRDLIDMYYDISSEIESDQDFDNNIFSTWDFQ